MRNHTLLFTVFFLALLSIDMEAKSKDSTEIRQLMEMEKRILPHAILINSAETDSLRREGTNKLRECLDSMLQLKASWEYPFDSLRSTVVSIVEPKDKAFRLFTFNTVLTNGNFKNFGFIQYKYKKKISVIPLMDTTKKWTKELQDIDLDPTEWVGALYYKVIPFKKGKDKMYMLLGFDGSTINSNKKIMDVLTLKKGEIRFGAAVFKNSEQDPSAEYRVVFEFHQQSSMLVNYEESENIIVIDKLAPPFPEANGNFYYYVPTGDYDFYSQDKYGNWVRKDFTKFNVGTQNEDPEVNPVKPKRKPRKL